MRINHNIAAMNTYNKLTANTAATSKSLEKLSSGLKINRAGDNAAGLAISEKMRSQIRGLDQANTNSQDGISLIQTAEGALNETHSILQRMRELAVQSSTGTTTNADRGAIQDEINQLVAEVDRVGNTTEYNNMKLIDGAQTQSLAKAANTASMVSLSAFNAVAEGTDYNVAVANVSKTVDNLTTAGNTGLAAGDFTITGGNYDVGSKIEIAVSDGASGAGFKNLTLTVNGVNIQTLTDHDVTAAATFNAVGYEMSIGANSFEAGAGSGNGTVKADFAMEADYTITKGAATMVSLTDVKSTDGVVRLGDFRAVVDKSLTANDDDFTISGKAMEFQIGANENQTSSLSIGDMRTAALGVDGLNLSTQSSAQSAITTIDAAIKLVSDERGKLGAVQNRLEHTSNNLSTSSENMSAAESRIRDVDMAKEMMEFTKNNILNQASTAMLAQANQQPQGVLQLLQ